MVEFTPEQLKKFGLSEDHQKNVNQEKKEKSSFRQKVRRQTTQIKFEKNPNYNRQARAPYNFIPLNEKVIDGQKREPFAIFIEKNNTGYIDCEVETITPLYMREGGENEKDTGRETNKQSTDFFSVANEKRIPGSSFRGLIHNLVEILSWSKLTTDHNRVLHYRGLADKSNLNKEYQNQLSSFDYKSKSITYEMNAGYLTKDGFSYQIIPAQQLAGDKYRKVKSKQFYQILEAETKVRKGYKNLKKGYFFKSDEEYVVVSGFMANKKHDWVINPPDYNNKRILIDAADIVIYRADENRTGPDITDELRKSKDNLVPCFYVIHKNNKISLGHTAMFRLAYEQSFGDLLPYEYIVSSLDMTETLFGTVNQNNNSALAGRVFFEDLKLNVNGNSIRQLKAIPEILASPKPTTFQHYLVQENATIRDLSHYNSNTILRGYKKYWHRKRDWLCKELSFDKASFNIFLGFKNFRLPEQHQEETDLKIKIKNVTKLDDSIKKLLFEYVQITNNFMQIPKSDFEFQCDKKIFKSFLKYLGCSIKNENTFETQNWIKIKKIDDLTDETFKKAISQLRTMLNIQTQYTVISAIPSGYKFSGRIRFENLSNEELGVILFALMLPEGCYHKMGMGKPIGLGSVKISSKLFLSKRNQRYSSLQTEWCKAYKCETQEKIDQFKSAFEKYIISKLDEPERPKSGKLWDTYRLQQLKVMLDWSNTELKHWNDRTRYLEIERKDNGHKVNEYKNRPVLPIPSQVIK